MAYRSEVPLKGQVEAILLKAPISLHVSGEEKRLF